MAAFYHPFLVDTSSPSLFIPTNNTKFLSSSFEPQHHINSTHQFPLLQQQPCSSQASKVTTTTSNYSHPSPPESSMVVDKLDEQVTRKLVTPMEIKNKRKITHATSSFNDSPLSKDSAELGRNKKQKKSNNGGEEKAKKEGPQEEEPPRGYIHVRARRGQATDSHSLAERVRREKISERMKLLQRLVPGCDKVTGKALVLDEIINYVQSLQNQVEFLSMKLASLNPLFFDFAMDLDTLLVTTPDQNLNSIPSSSVKAQCSPNHATTFDDGTTMTNTFPTAANNDNYLLDYYSSPAFLQGHRSNVLSEYGQLLEVEEEERQKLVHPYGFGNNLCSLN